MAYDAYDLNNMNRHRLLSRPLKILWAGWESDTYQLQKAGWKLSAYQDIRGNRLQLAFEHGHRGQAMRAITSVIPFQYERTIDDVRYISDMPSLHVEQAIGGEVWITQHGSVDFYHFQAIDAEPRLTARKVTRLEDLAHFASPLIRTNEIIIPEESVPDLLERILKLQQPARTDRIREELRGEMRHEQKFHAQIISLKRDAA